MPHSVETPELQLDSNYGLLVTGRIGQRGEMMFLFVWRQKLGSLEQEHLLQQVPHCGRSTRLDVRVAFKR